jgi:hypothetical protein
VGAPSTAFTAPFRATGIFGKYAARAVCSALFVIFFYLIVELILNILLKNGANIALFSDTGNTQAFSRRRRRWDGGSNVAVYISRFDGMIIIFNFASEYKDKIDCYDIYRILFISGRDAPPVGKR